MDNAEPEYIKHEYAKGVWYEVVRRCPRTRAQRMADEFMEQTRLNIQRAQQPSTYERSRLGLFPFPPLEDLAGGLIL